MKTFQKIIKEELLGATPGLCEDFCTIAFYWPLLSFNCIQPHILADGLTSIHNIDPGLICWLADFLTDRPQKVKVNGVLSDALLSFAGSPRGVSSQHFYLFCIQMSVTVIMRADMSSSWMDSVIVSLLSNDATDHGPVVDEFSDWCSFLDINVSKTKEMMIDFLSSCCCGQAVEVIQ